MMDDEKEKLKEQMTDLNEAFTLDEMEEEGGKLIFRVLNLLYLIINFLRSCCQSIVIYLDDIMCQ